MNRKRLPRLFAAGAMALSIAANDAIPARVANAAPVGKPTEWGIASSTGACLVAGGYGRNAHPDRE